MSYGLAKVGVNVVGGVDIDISCRSTYELNNSGAQFITADVSEITPNELMEKVGLSVNDDNLVAVGCSPCQFWSKINTNRTRSKKTAFLLHEFGSFVAASLPGWVLVENVPGILRKKNSALPKFLKLLDDLGYKCAHGLVDMSKYGIPQTRHRFVLIATRLSCDVSLPRPAVAEATTVRDVLGVENGFPRIEAGHLDETSFCHTSSKLSEINLKRIKSTKKDGGTRMDWSDNPALSVPAYKERTNQFSDVYSRMSWDKPAPTITTRFNSFSNGRFGHPEEHRAISLREGAILQTFPKGYQFLEKSTLAIARHIGNAVPPKFAEILGSHILNLHTQA